MKWPNEEALQDFHKVMKINKKHIKPASVRRSNGGFALIACLTLMMLLGLLAVGILAVASSQNRIAAHLALQTAARQQALMGLDAAVAELQMHAGCDQRVTASSGILSNSDNGASHILGVWNSWQAPLYGKSDGKDIRSTYTEGRSSMFRHWLISCRTPQSLNQLNAADSLSHRLPGTRVCLVGEGTLGRSSNQSQYVYADIISMPAGAQEGGFAWWVGGENQKANIAIRNRPESKDPIEILRRTWDTPAPSFADSNSQLANTANIEEPEKVISLGTLPLVGHSSAKGGHPYFFDATVYSYTLPTNVRDGGLKHDLNLLLTKKNLDNTEFARRPDQDCPIAEGEGLPEGTEPHMPIGSWQVMHAYYNTWPDGTKGDNDFSARLQGTLRQAYSLMSGNLISESTDKGDNVTYFDTRTLDNDGRAGYARTPVLTAFLGCWGLQVSQTKYRKGNTLHYVYSPMAMWWNPYNVPLRVGAKKLWAYPLPYRTTSVQAWDDRVHDLLPSPRSSKPWSPRLIMHTCESKGTGIPWQHAFRLDWGNYFVNSETDLTSDIVFAPGEVIAFTLAGDVLSMNEIDSYGIPHEFPFIVGDHPERMTHFRSDFQEYVSLTNPNANSMYDMYIDRFHARLKLESKNTPYFNGEVAYGLMTNGKQGDYFVTMGEVRGAAAAYTDEDHTHVAGREAFAITHGYDGLHNDASGDANIRRSGQVDRFCGAKGISPSSFMLGWYDYEEISGDEMTFMDEAWSIDMFGQDPVYYVALGIVPKSYNQSFNEKFPMFRGKDYRTKSWQHSLPAFWGSALNKPDDQQRQYHPFQLAALDMGSALNRGVLDTVNGRNGVYGITSVGGGGGEDVSFISCLELPVHPPFSLAGFAGMRLTPGWYESKGSGNMQAVSRARRAQYQAGVPGVGIGNAFADPCLPPDDVYAFHESKINNTVASNARVFSDFYDHALIINDALWDRWFCSSISDMPEKGGGRLPAAQVLNRFVSGEEDLPVSRYKLANKAISRSQIVSKIMDSDGWKIVAGYLMIEGGFNVNSTSEDAWAAVLQGLAKRDLVTNATQDLQKVDRRGDSNVLFSRFMVSTGTESIDGGGYSPLHGLTGVRPNMKMAAAWCELRELTSDQIRELAREMVKRVRERGPFLNMSDFINRRLDGGTKAALTGALQEAIDATDINACFKDDSYTVTPAAQGSLYRFSKAEEGSLYTAAPGYLIQSDVLMSLGNILTVRDDTFVVRAYGCVRNNNKATLAAAWCEAVVQRTIDYVDPYNSPEDAPPPPANSRRTQSGKQLSEINAIMGRRFRIVSFRWLDAWDI